MQCTYTLSTVLLLVVGVCTRMLVAVSAHASETQVYYGFWITACMFVRAKPGLASRCVHMCMQALFDCKGMAGNIIHAIATTNAITAGFIVVEALKLLAGTTNVL